ncbi:MAG: DUF86 domain-containing protein [Sphingobacteriaceae bacterium]|nr:MAG: DUF86 domain-containing protein [Sphingobacteriaceae bacterium]
MSDYHKDVIRVKHVLDAIEKLIILSENKSFDDFESDIAYQLASIKLLEIIGEASNHISQASKNFFLNIPWRQIIGLRNILVHEYFGVDHFTIWDIIQNSIQPLQIQFSVLLKQLSENN